MGFSKFISATLVLWLGVMGVSSEVSAEKDELDRNDLTFVKRSTTFTGKSPYAIVVVRGLLPGENPQRGLGSFNYVSLHWQMYDPVKKTLIEYESDLKDRIGVGVIDNPKDKLKKRFNIYRIYPGHYLLAAMTNISYFGNGQQLNFHYITGETLAFEAEPGKVYYLGDFEIRADSTAGLSIGGYNSYSLIGHDVEAVKEFLALYKKIDAELVIPDIFKDTFKCNNTKPYLSQRKKKRNEQFCETELRRLH